MARPALAVRPAVIADADAIIGVVSLVRTSGREEETLDHAATRRRISNAIERHDVSIAVADVNGEIVGVVVYRTSDVLPLVSVRALHVESVVVHPDWRNRGLARALLRHVVCAAEAARADQIVSSVMPTDREAARFLARLGFEPLVTMRAASTRGLRRRLFSDQSHTPATGINRVIASRRRQLGRAG